MFYFGFRYGLYALDNNITMNDTPLFSITSPENQHYRFMQQAINEAQVAASQGEVPVGAVVVWKNRIIARGHNQVELLNDPTAHAEMIALSAALEHLEEKYLTACTVYVTLEPCPMCAGAFVWSKLGKLVIAAQDEKAGACGSLFNIGAHKNLNHHVEMVHGIMESESQALLRDFFQKRR